MEPLSVTYEYKIIHKLIEEYIFHWFLFIFVQCHIEIPYCLPLHIVCALLAGHWYKITQSLTHIGFSSSEKKQTLACTGYGGEESLDELDLVIIEIFGEFRGATRLSASEVTVILKGHTIGMDVPKITQINLIGFGSLLCYWQWPPAPNIN